MSECDDYQSCTYICDRLIQKYFDEISTDTGRYCFGVDDTLRGLEMGAVETLIVWEDLDVMRRVLRDSNGAEIVIHTAAPPTTAGNSRGLDQSSSLAGGSGSVGIAMLSEKDQAKFLDKTTGLEMEQAKDPQLLIEWLAENYKEFGATLEFVTNRSQEGSQFVRGLPKSLDLTRRELNACASVGFGGIGGMLRYKVDFAQISEVLDEVCGIPYCCYFALLTYCQDADEFYDSDEDGP